MFYKYNVVTGKYEGTTEIAKYDLRTGKLLNGFTKKQPPEIPDGKELFYENDEWVLKDIDYNSLLSNKKQQLLNNLKTMFEDYANNKAIMHSTTLDKDVNARRIDLINIDGLVATIGTNTVQFRCADNTFVEVDADKLKALKLELIQYGQKMYQNKWAIEQQINALTTDDINKQYEIDLVNGQLVEK